jgi:hypothetical protein
MDPQATMDIMHRLMIKREVALWFSSGRAIHAWRLRKIFRDAKWPVPEEIELYLDACAERLCQADLISPEAVADAFDLDRKGRNAAVTSDQLAAAESVFGLLAMNADRRRRGEEEWSLGRAIDATAQDLNERRPEGAKDTGSYVRAAYYAWLEHIQNVCR